MALISLEFLVFVCIAVAGYYTIPKKAQWIWLLVFSYIYYAASGIWLMGYILSTTISTYLAGIYIDKINNQEGGKDKKKITKGIVALALLFNFGLLGVVKYTDFTILNINRVFSTSFSFQNLIMPLGISFYTFQSMGYLLDVHWRKVKPERNLFRFSLFVSFFPQILQGPIGRFQRLGKQLYAQHKFDRAKFEYGLLLILWGFFKKMVLADNIAEFVNQVFNHYEKYHGVVILLGILGYSVQLYGDFSGGMDVVKGIAYLFGIELDDNFRRPFFARSITDFWHRWHITLGTWMKDYVFYPLSLSKPMGKFKKVAKKYCPKNIARTLPICLANIIVFLVVGIWHGPAWHFILYGLYNGIIIAISGLLAPSYRQWKKKLGIDETKNWWILFQILRTFLLVNISWLLDRGDTLKQAVTMFKKLFQDFALSDLWNGAIFVPEVTSIKVKLAIVLFGCILLFIVSLLQEKGKEVHTFLLSQPIMVRIVIFLMLFFMLPLLGGTPLMEGGFIYAQF